MVARLVLKCQLVEQVSARLAENRRQAEAGAAAQGEAQEREDYEAAELLFAQVSSLSAGQWPKMGFCFAIDQYFGKDEDARWKIHQPLSSFLLRF